MFDRGLSGKLMWDVLQSLVSNNLTQHAGDFTARLVIASLHRFRGGT